jgi:hypothetical protein
MEQKMTANMINIILFLMLSTALTIKSFYAATPLFPCDKESFPPSPEETIVIPKTYTTKEEEERLTDEFIKSFLRNKKFKLGSNWKPVHHPN